jgi:hypothetical protein
MRTKNIATANLFLVSLTAFCILAFAHKGYAKPGGGVWKKQTTRIIDLGEQEDTIKHHMKDASPDTTLVELWVNAFKAGRLTLYSNIDHSFTTKLKREQLLEMLTSKPDTVIMFDPVDGKEVLKVIHHDLNYSAFRKYRILEDWTFDAATGKTSVEITGIAPLREIYGEAGDFRGVQAMFWIRYKDARPIIEKYERYHPTNTISSKIWNDYFYADEVKDKN